MDHTKLWKILKQMGLPDHLTFETCMQVKKQQLQPNMEQQTGSKLGKEYIKRNSGLEESQAGIKIAGRNIQQPQICR